MSRLQHDAVSPADRPIRLLLALLLTLTGFALRAEPAVSHPVLAIRAIGADGSESHGHPRAAEGLTGEGSERRAPGAEGGEGDDERTAPAGAAAVARTGALAPGAVPAVAGPRATRGMLPPATPPPASR